MMSQSPGMDLGWVVIWPSRLSSHSGVTTQGSAGSTKGSKRSMASRGIIGAIESDQPHEWIKVPTSRRGSIPLHEGWTA